LVRLSDDADFERDDSESSLLPETWAEMDELAHSRASNTGRPVVAATASGSGEMSVSDWTPLTLSERREARWLELYQLVQRLGAEDDPSATRLGELLRRGCWDDDPDYDPDQDAELAPFVAELDEPRTHDWKKVASVPLEHPSPSLGPPPKPWVQRLRPRRPPAPRSSEATRPLARPREQRARRESAGGSRASPSSEGELDPPPATGLRRWLRRLLGGDA
jgi:hypothetical protein